MASLRYTCYISFTCDFYKGSAEGAFSALHKVSFHITYISYVSFRGTPVMLNNVEPADQFHAVAAWNVDPEMATLPAFPIGAPHQALEETSEIAIDDLVFTVVAAFRRHPHLNNVLTHISGARWERVEQALRAILDPVSRSRELSPLARNIVDLM